MKTIYDSNSDYNFMKPTGVGLGNFDGLHLGHMALINTLINESLLNSLESVVYTFMKHPENIIRKKLFKPLITTIDKKIELLNQTGLKYAYFEKFDEEYSRIKPENFVKNVLVEKLNMKLAVAGYDYRFGYRGQGDINLLKELGKKFGFKVIVIPPVKLDDKIVSSSIIRKYIKKGCMGKVFLLLGRHYSITGKVEKGKGIGKTLGFPTVNIIPEKHVVFPAKGVYISKVKIKDSIHFSITNVGNNPTFDNDGNISVETFILDFSSEIYGEHIEIYFIEKIRGEKKFNSVEQLVEEIKKDVLKAKDYFCSHKRYQPVKGGILE
ncbi:bifunctional riboflavin kinase/FAD synthetase [Herbivorax sp. ANBcel31]|uniref:bifunctional riboflavin kinase/FAD synthetase n=1 Tax=Herbivorax sp. ANBcel31 TaxID=3069754 RepID=UPI0027B72BA9|nr:bifunctional riboflavin kinase/FAD synthetase [Herbivorax sp. ANBcel31]MDQ2086892.1 bifunctional riboflavin kinase/FAD synthetase [Herbivorax sp. ANBcel31]